MCNALAIDIYSNKNYVMINTIIFKLPNGTTITVDRNKTEYSITKANPSEAAYDYLITIDWKECYICTINGHHLWFDPSPIMDYEEFSELIKDAEVEFELEEDAGPDYRIDLISVDITEA